MNLAILSQPLDTMEFGVDGLHSIPTLTANFAVRLAERGHDVTIYGATTTRQRRGLAGAEGMPGVRMAHVRMPALWQRALMAACRRGGAMLQPSCPFVGSSLYDPVYPARAALDARRSAIEIMHIHNFSQYGGIVKAICTHIKMVLHMHCLWLSSFKKKLIGARLRHFDRIICCSNFVRDDVCATFPEHAHKVFTLYNGVDTDRFDGHLHDDSGQDVYFVGRISPEKGLHILIQAFKLVTERLPEARLFIVGSPAAMPRSIYETLGEDPVLEEHAGYFYRNCEVPQYARFLHDEVDLSLRGRVNFLGALPHSELVDRLRSATLVVKPSLCREAFGMPAAEAMAMGLPVVVTRAGGLVEIVDDGNTGLIVGRGRVDELARAMIELLQAPAVRRRAIHGAARRRALELFSFARLAGQLEEHYRSLLVHGHGALAAKPV